MPQEFEDELGEALRRSADTFQPDDPAALVGAGHRTGRRMRRRRTATVVAGAAALAAVAVGGVAAGGLAGGGGHRSAVAASPELSMAGKPTNAPPVSGKQVAGILRGLIPAGDLAGLTGSGTDEGNPYVTASAVYDDGHGPGAIAVGIQWGSSVQGCPPPAQNPGEWCSVTHVGGGTLQLFKGWEYPDHRGGLKEWMATFVTRGGGQVQLSEWNSTSEKGSATTRANPPLDLATMSAVVESPEWDKVLAALPKSTKYTGKDTGSPAAGGSSADGKAVAGRG